MSNSVSVSRFESSMGSHSGKAPAPAGDDLDASSLWPRLAAGTLRASASYCTPSHCCLELQRVIKGSPPSPKDVEALERILLGAPQKVVAFERRVSISTVGSRAGRCLQTFGLDGRVSAVPTSLVMLVQVHWRRSPIAGSEISAAAHSDHSSIQVSLPRPDLGLDDLFSPAEREVIHLLVEGKTQLEMAQHRNTSPRTIANQICSVYLKGRVSGRLALINSLIAPQAAPREARGSAAEVDAK